MKALLKLFLSVSLCWTVGAAGEGLPLPWPFPWAKDCAVDWKAMEGRYLLSESSSRDQIDLRVTVLTSHGFRLVHMSRYNGNGEFIADGLNIATSVHPEAPEECKEEGALCVRLIPRNRYETPTWAMIKLHYSDWNLGCAADHLVPILTLEKEKSSTKPSYYRLVRINPEKD